MHNSRYSVLGLPLIAAVACVPTTARTNAKLDPGVNVGFSGGAQFVGAGQTDSGGSTPAKETIPHLELDIEWAQQYEGESGFAIQVKVPINIVFATLDLYHSFAPQGQTYFGFGAEIGALPGLYGAVTHYVNDKIFITFTPRALFTLSHDGRGVLINPQLSVGSEGQADLVAFASFAHHTGRGFDFDVDLFGEDDTTDYRKNFGLVGISARF